MDVSVTLLGGFAVTVDGTASPSSGWTRRHAAALVKVLALAPGHRLHREQVLDLLWPDDAPADAGPKLHKAAHFARKATGHSDVIVLRGESVRLFPGADLAVDAIRFEELARRALAEEDPDLADDALDVYAGELLPEDRYEDWAVERRESLRLRHLDLLRLLERWEEVADLDPSDERAHVVLMRRYVSEGDRHAALRQFERMDRVLRTELGVRPGADACAIRDSLLAAESVPRPSEPELIGREREIAVLRQSMADIASGRARTIVTIGRPGIGKSALLRAARDLATARGWRVGHGIAAPVEGAWPYAPILDAVADLCRRHATLLDGLPDGYHDEIDRALSGRHDEWSGQSGHQRLFVAVAELVRLAAATTGLLLVIDDLHDADDASLRLLHYLARATIDEKVLILVSHRPSPLSPALAETRASLIGRHGAIELELGPLDLAGVRALVARHVPEPEDGLVERIAALADGVPFSVAELARRAVEEPDWVNLLDATVIGGIPPATREVLQRVAVVGSTFDTDEFVALSGLADTEAYDHLDAALAGRLVERADAGYRFRHGLVRDTLLEDVPPHRRRRIHVDAAVRLEQLGASPARVGYHLVQADEPGRAAPYLLRAAETEAAVGAYRDALALVDTVRAHASAADRGRVLALRANLLMAIGDPTATAAYREALEGADPPAQRRLRARLARAAVMSGDLETAAAALDGIAPDGGPDDGEILLAQGNIAFLSSDFDRAWAIAEEARQRVLLGDQSWQVLDLISLQGLLAHNRGEWFDRMRGELRRSRDAPEIANALFDGYLCAAEYLLYGPTPYAEVIELAREMRATAQRSGALRAVAFATALIGEAALLAGELDLAAAELAEAVDLHHDLGSGAGEAHSLQRLAEVRLAQGDRAESTRLLHRALPLARWSMLALHLLQRIYGTMIAAAPDADSARAVVDRAESTLGSDDACLFCSVMLSVPAAIACAGSGDIAHARDHLAIAERSAKMWEGTSWEAWIAEASAHVAIAEGDPGQAGHLLADAVAQFERAGQPLDVARCRELLTRVGGTEWPQLASESPGPR
jgi:DNA-binding SARP family transcriptional activator/tetratricopeptide (TPR) repeat protein